jgi:hypothetical protein
MGPLSAFVVGMAVFFYARQEQQPFFREHPELPNPFEKQHRHPAE